MPETTTDEVAAALAGIRELIAAQDELVDRGRQREAIPLIEFNAAQDRLAERVPPLLAALEAAVLKLPAKWEQEASALDATATRLPSAPAYAMRVDAGQLRDCARELRKAISRELLGKEESRG